jgi:hypothetical protein
MNISQIVALVAYVIVMFFFFYFATNKFEKGWIRNLAKGNKFNIDIWSFRLIAVVLVVGFVLLFKLLE